MTKSGDTIIFINSERSARKMTYACNFFETVFVSIDAWLLLLASHDHQSSTL